MLTGSLLTPTMSSSMGMPLSFIPTIFSCYEFLSLSNAPLFFVFFLTSTIILALSSYPTICLFFLSLPPSSRRHCIINAILCPLFQNPPPRPPKAAKAKSGPVPEFQCNHGVFSVRKCIEGKGKNTKETSFPVKKYRKEYGGRYYKIRKMEEEKD